MMQRLLPFRALLFVILLPGTVAGLVPIHILNTHNNLRVPAFSFSAGAGMALLLCGAAVLLSCVWHFFAAGKGTLAPVDPPRHLVVMGLYRYTRNPMYNGVLFMLLGEAWLFQSVALLRYAAGFLAVVHLFVVLYEERTLESRFGPAYRAYRAAVPRWGFTVRSFTRHGTGSS